MITADARTNAFGYRQDGANGLSPGRINSAGHLYGEYKKKLVQAEDIPEDAFTISLSSVPSCEIMPTDAYTIAAHIRACGHPDTGMVKIEIYRSVVRDPKTKEFRPAARGRRTVITSQGIRFQCIRGHVFEGTPK